MVALRRRTDVHTETLPVEDVPEGHVLEPAHLSSLFSLPVSARCVR